MDLTNVDSFMGLDPSQMFRAERFLNQALTMYNRDDELTENYLRGHLGGGSLRYALQLLDETTTTYMGVQIHNQNGKFSAPTAGVYNSSSRPELKAKIKEKVLKRNERENKNEEVEQVDELYKGKHGQTEKQYQDSRSDAGKMVSGDSKMSGSRYAQGRRTSSDAGPQTAGGSQKPASQGKMDSGSRTDLTFRKAALKKKSAEKNEEVVNEEGADSLKDRRMERGGVDGNNRYNKAPGKPNTFGKKKPSGMSAFDKVTADLKSKYGDKSIISKKTESLDPVGQEDDDIDNDGKKNDKNDKYLRKRRAAIGKSIATRKEEVVLNVIESFFADMIDEGYHEDDIVEAFDIALTEATVSYGHDTEKPKEPFKKNTTVRHLAKAVGRLAKRTLMKKGSELKQKAQDTYKQKKSDLKGKVRNVALNVASRMKEEIEIAEGDYWHPDPEKDRKLGGPGANARAREDRADAAKPKADPKKLKPGESYMDYSKRQKSTKSGTAASRLAAKGAKVGSGAPVSKKKSLLGRLGLRKEEIDNLCVKCNQDECECKIAEEFKLFKTYILENGILETEDEVIEAFETIDDDQLEDILESAIEMKGKKKGNVIINPTPKKVQEDADASKKMQIQRKQLTLNKQKIALQQKATSKKTSTDMHVEENLHEVDMTTRSPEFGAEIENTVVKRKKEKKSLSDFKKLSMGGKTKSEEVEQIGESEYRKMLAKERQSEREKESKRGGSRSVTPGKSTVATGKSYADSQIGSIKLHDKQTKKNKNVVGLVTKEQNEIEEGSMKQARKNVGAKTCWDGYESKGTKLKGGRQVPNCVKKK